MGAVWELSHGVIGLNPTSWIDLFFQLRVASLHAYAISKVKLCSSKASQSILSLAQKRHWLAHSHTSQLKVVSSAPSLWPSLGASLLNHLNGQWKQSLRFTSPLSEHLQNEHMIRHYKFHQEQQQPHFPPLHDPLYWTSLSEQQFKKCLTPSCNRDLGCHLRGLYLVAQKQPEGLGKKKNLLKIEKNIEMFLK